MYTEKSIYSVSLLTNEAKKLLEASYASIQVEGEISGFMQPASGHQYFNLKDENAQVRCVFFRNNARLSPVTLKDGMHVVLSARVSLYEQRGDFQLIVKSAVDAGEGQLRKKFEQLKARLYSEGLFDPASKLTLPTLPTRVGIITSTTGAAIHDIISVFKRRYPSIKLLIYPSLVQGGLAAKALLAAIKTANSRHECDVLILARGGGSLEDLWPFNEEIVARAIHQSTIPLVSAVGHESDFTISDLVADFRAATPTAAAELLSPDLRQMTKNTINIANRLNNAFGYHLEARSQNFDHLQLRLQIFKQLSIRASYQYDILSKTFINVSRSLITEKKHQLNTLTSRIHQPETLLNQYSLRSSNFQTRLARSIKNRNLSSMHSFMAQKNRLSHHLPANILKYKFIQHDNVCQRLWTKTPDMLQRKRNQFEANVTALQALSPLKTLARGFATLQIKGESKTVTSVTQLKLGDELKARLQDGYVHCKINEIQRDLND